MPGDMPMTKRLDKMTIEQAVWAIANGSAWIAYLKEQMASGEDVDIAEHDATSVDVSVADKYQAICDTLERVWLDLTDNMAQSYLEKHQNPDWVETLQWAVKVMPKGYEKHRDIIKTELAAYQPLLTKSKTRKRKER